MALQDNQNVNFASEDAPHFVSSEAEPTVSPEQVAAWQEVEPGRFMPKRIRGSCVGRALG